MTTLTALSNLAKESIANSGDSNFTDLFPVNPDMVDRIRKSIKEKRYDKSQPIHVWKEGMLIGGGDQWQH